MHICFFSRKLLCRHSIMWRCVHCHIKFYQLINVWYVTWYRSGTKSLIRLMFLWKTAVCDPSILSPVWTNRIHWIQNKMRPMCVFRNNKYLYDYFITFIISLVIEQFYEQSTDRWSLPYILFLILAYPSIILAAIPMMVFYGYYTTTWIISGTLGHGIYVPYFPLNLIIALLVIYVAFV